MELGLQVLQESSTSPGGKGNEEQELAPLGAGLAPWGVGAGAGRHPRRFMGLVRALVRATDGSLPGTPRGQRSARAGKQPRAALRRGLAVGAGRPSPGEGARALAGGRDKAPGAMNKTAPSGRNGRPLPHPLLTLWGSAVPPLQTAHLPPVWGVPGRIRERGHGEAGREGQTVSPALCSPSRCCCPVPENPNQPRKPKSTKKTRINEENKVPVPKSLQTMLGRAQALQQQLEQRHSCMCC